MELNIDPRPPEISQDCEGLRTRFGELEDISPCYSNLAGSSSFVTQDECTTVIDFEVYHMFAKISVDRPAKKESEN
jgi:hypothetical protein